MGSNHEKTGGRKSRDTLPLRYEYIFRKWVKSSDYMHAFMCIAIGILLYILLGKILVLS